MRQEAVESCTSATCHTKPRWRFAAIIKLHSCDVTGCFRILTKSDSSVVENSSDIDQKVKFDIKKQTNSNL